MIIILWIRNSFLNRALSLPLSFCVCLSVSLSLPSSSLSLGKPRSVGGSERVQLSGVFNVRKGKLALPVNRWSKRQVTLCGTCLIVSSVKHAHTGKMHILPLIGGKVLSQESQGIFSVVGVYQP